MSIAEALTSRGADRLSASLVATAGKDVVAVLPGFASAWPGARAIGSAFTVRGARGDNLALHQALAASPHGSIIIADVGGDTAVGYWGELLAISAQVRGVSGLVVAGSIRDRAEIAALRFPVFHRGVSPRPAAKNVPGQLAVALEFGGAGVRPGDLVVADDDGVVVVPARESERVVAAALELAQREEEIGRRLARGETTIEVLGL